jgi:transposase
MARARRKFSEEFKQEAVRLVTVRGVSMAQAARDLSIHVNLLRTWMRTATSAAAAATGRQSAKSEQAELTRLRKEAITLRMERDILEKAAAYFASESM